MGFHDQSAKGRMVEESVGVCEEAPGNDRIGIVIGCSLAVPFLLASVLAVARGARAEAVVWFGSALLMVVTMTPLALWSSRRD